MTAAVRVACAVGLVALAGAAQAQQYHEYLPDAGTKEIDLSASITFKPNDSQNLIGRVGYFLDRNLEVGLDGAYIRIKDTSVNDSWSIGGFGNLHFPNASPVLPYVGVFAGISDRLRGDTAASFGLQGGAKYFLNPNVAGFAEFRWRNAQFGTDQTGVFLGLSIFVK